MYMMINTFIESIKYQAMIIHQILLTVHLEAVINQTVEKVIFQLLLIYKQQIDKDE